MATHWWIAGVNTDYGTIGNWSATEGGASNGTTPGTSDDIYFSNTSSMSDCILGAGSSCNHAYFTAADTGGTDGWEGTLDTNDYSFTILGNITTYMDMGLDFGASAVACSGNWDTSGVDFLSGTSTITLDGTSKTVETNTTATKRPYNLTTTGTITASAAITIDNDWSTTAGTFVDAGYAISVGGDISIANVAGLLTSTGTWTATGTGNLENKAVSNVFFSLVVGQPTKTTTVISTTYTKKLTVGSGSCLKGSSQIGLRPTANDFLIIDSAATVDCISSFTIATDVNVGAISCAGWTGLFSFIVSSAKTLTWAGAWNVPNISTGGAYGGGTLDFNDYDVTMNILKLGASVVSTIDLYLGNGTITLGQFTRYASTKWAGDYYFEGATINVSSTVDFGTNVTVQDSGGTSTLNLTGSAAVNIELNDQPINDLVVNGVGSTKKFIGTIDCADFTVTAGTIDNSVNNPLFNISGSLSISAGSFWTKGTGTITFAGAGSGTQTITSNSKDLEGVVCNDAGAILQLADALTCTSLQIDDGDFDENIKTVTTSGAFAINSNSDISDFGGATFNVGGNFSANGASEASKLTIAAATTWFLNVTGGATAQYVDVQNSDASGGTEVDANLSTDTGGNTNWNFYSSIADSFLDSTGSRVHGTPRLRMRRTGSIYG